MRGTLRRSLLAPLVCVSTSLSGTDPEDSLEEELVPEDSLEEELVPLTCPRAWSPLPAPPRIGIFWPRAGC